MGSVAPKPEVLKKVHEPKELNQSADSSELGTPLGSTGSRDVPKKADAKAIAKAEAKAAKKAIEN